jgi:hypothetical protein
MRTRGVGKMASVGYMSRAVAVDVILPFAFGAVSKVFNLFRFRQVKQNEQAIIKRPLLVERSRILTFMLFLSKVARTVGFKIVLRSLVDYLKILFLF